MFSRSDDNLRWSVFCMVIQKWFHSIIITINLRLGPRFNIKISSYQYRKSHCGDKTVVRSSYLHDGISYTGKTTSLYWIRALFLYEDSLSEYRDFHYRVKRILRPFYLYTVNSSAIETSSLYWKGPQYASWIFFVWQSWTPGRYLVSCLCKPATICFVSLLR